MKGVDMHIMNIFLVVYFGIYGNNRNSGDEKMAKKGDYTLTSGLHNTF